MKLKLKMAKNSIFAILLRSSWWISASVALAIIVLAQAVLPPMYMAVGASAALPFIIIAAISGYRQARRPSAERVDAVAQRVATLPWRTFADMMQAALVQDGAQVRRLDGQGGADFVLVRKQRIAVMACRRWKIAQLGVEPLRELQAAREAHGAHEAIFVLLGGLSENAAAYAKQHDIQLLGAPELARLLDSDR